MSHNQPPRTDDRRARAAARAALVALAAVLIGIAACRPAGDSGSAAPPRPPAVAISSERQAVEDPGRRVGRDDAGPPPLGEAGRVADGQTVFDEGSPAVAELDPALLAALRRAATDAARDGVELHVNSGWRSAEYQEQLLRDAIAEYGSQAEAARWVATPETSAHVSGDAVDIGPSEATAWLSRHGSRYGLCQIYENEPWHYELRPEALDRGCPPMYADPTHDPRMQR